MKNTVKTTVPLIVTVFMVITCACASAPQPVEVQGKTPGIAEAQVNFADVQNKDWNLTEIRTKGESIRIERGKLAEESAGKIFTLRFDKERVSGAGAPNRYFAPYTLGDKGAVTIKTVAGTMMAAFREPKELKEREFFALLQNVYKWNLSGEKLELYSKKEDGAEAVLVFTEEKK